MSSSAVTALLDCGLERLDGNSMFTKLTALLEIVQEATESSSSSEIAVIRGRLAERLPELMKNTLGKSKSHADALAVLARLLADHVLSFETSIESAIKIKDLGRSLLARTSSAKTKSAGLELIRLCVERWCGSENAEKMEAAQLEKALVSVLTQPSKHTPGVVGLSSRALGALCRAYPDETGERKDTVFGYLDGQIEAQMSSRTRQVDLPVIEGCLRGLDDFLTAFGLPDEEYERREKVYDKLMRICPKPAEETSRRTAMRTAVVLFANHCGLFGDFVINDVVIWHKTLNEWAFSFNRDDHKTGWKAMLAFYKTAGEQLGKTSNERAFAFLLKTFRNILVGPTSSGKEISLAIQGYGHLAAACKRLLSGDEVSVMLYTLLQRSEQMFLNHDQQREEEVSFGDDKHLHLSSYVEAVTQVVEQVDAVSPACCVTFERILVHLVSKFPFLPVQYRPFALQAVLRALGKTPQKLMPDLLSNFTYQGVIQSCSYPIVTKMEEKVALDLGGSMVVSVASFVPFWCGLMKTWQEDESAWLHEAIFDCLINSFMAIMGKLDFNMHMSRSCEDDDEVLDGEKVAVKAKDFTVMANLVRLCQSILSTSMPRLFAKWILPFGLSVASLSNKYPQVSGFYRMFGCALAAAGRDFFEEDRNHNCIRRFGTYVEEALNRSNAFEEEELLLSCLEMCLQVPPVIAGEILQAFTRPLKRIFGLGARNLPLISSAVSFLTELTDCLGSDKTEPLMIHLIPTMKHFIQASSMEAEDADESKESAPSKRARRNNRMKVKGVELEESELEVTQKAVLLFLGRLDMDMLTTCLLLSKEELGRSVIATNADRCLDFAIPFPDVNLDITLDDFLPRLLQMCDKTADRKTRVAASETLHSVVLLIIGRTANQSSQLQRQRPMTSMYSQLFPIMIKLSGDSDIVIKDLFHPLLLQCIHWFTRPVSSSDPLPETSCLLDAIMDGVCAESDAALRKRSAQLLAEFLNWSIKQTPPDKMKKKEYSANPSSLFSRLIAMWMHPSPLQRLGASLAFNHCYRIFREEEPLVDKFTVGIAVRALQSIGLTKDKDVDFGAVEEAKKTLDHLLRIMKQKAKLLEAEAEDRIVPSELGGNGLAHFVVWLHSLIDSSSTEQRRKAMELIFQLTIVKQSQSYFQESIERSGFASERSYFEHLGDSEAVIVEDHKSVLAADATKLRKWICSLTCVSECLTFTIDRDLTVVENVIVDYMDSFVRSLSAFIFFVTKLNDDQECKRTMTSADSSIEKNICTMIIRLLDLVVACLKHSRNDAFVKSVWNETFCHLVTDVACHSSRLGFDPRVKEVQSGLEERCTSLLDMSKTKKPSLFERLKRTSVKKELELQVKELMMGRVNEEQKQIFKGCKLLHSHNVISLRDFGEKLEEDVSSIYDLDVPRGEFEQEFREAVSAFFDLFLAVSKNASKTLTKLCTMFLERPSCSAVENLVVSCSMGNPQVFLDAVESNASNPNRAQLCFVKFLRACVMHQREVLNTEEQIATVNRIWQTLEGSSFESESQLETAILLAKTLGLAGGEKCFEGSVAPWLCLLLRRKDVRLKIKTKALDLLTLVLKSQKMGEVDVPKSLDSLSDTCFPIYSTELPMNSSQRRDYVECFEQLFTVLAATASLDLLRFVLIIIYREESHVCQDRMMECLSVLPKNRTTSEQLDLVQVAFELVDKDIRCDSAIKLRVLAQALVPLLAGSSTMALEKFFTSQLDWTIEGLLRSELIGSEEKRTNDLVKRIGACKLVGCVYAGLDKERLHSASSSIARSAYEILKSRGQPLKGDFTGKELGKFLVSRLTSFRSVPIDRSSTLSEIFRQFHCAAYNATMSVITCLQSEEKFYFTYLFKEDPSRGEMIWSRVVDTDCRYDFPLEVETFARKRKQIVTLRKSKKAHSRADGPDTSLGLMTLASSYLGDSSLSQDVGMFDFNQSIVTINGSPATRPEPESHANEANMISLENESLNNHECMGPLLALIDYMTDTKIYQVPEEGKAPGALPSWISCLTKKMEDDSVPKNVKLFLLKVMCNRSECFAPFASLLGKVILRLTVAEEIWESPTDVNTLRLDLVAMLLSWSDRYVPQNSMMEKSFASSLLEIMVSACLNQTNRELLKYMLEMVRTMCTTWGGVKCLTSPGRLLQSNPTSIVVVQLTGIFLQSGLPPANESSVLPLFTSLATNMDSRTKQQYLQAAEVLGMAMAFYKNDLSQFPQLHMLTEERLARLSKSPLAHDRAKFFDCLHACHKNFPDIVLSFYKKFVYTLKSEGGLTLTQCLEMLAACTQKLAESENGLQKELGMVGLVDFLAHFDADNQLASLSVFKGLMPWMPADLMNTFVDTILSRYSSKSSAIRVKVIAIAKECCLKYKDSSTGNLLEAGIVRRCLAVLTRAFGDKDESVVSSAKGFFEEVLPDFCGQRVSDVVKLLLNTEGQDHFLSASVSLLLGLTEKSPQLDAKLFRDPLSADCHFQEQHFDTSWRSSSSISQGLAGSAVVPRFAETLTSSSQAWTQSTTAASQAASTIDFAGYIRATQVKLEFEQTQTQQLKGPPTPSFKQGPSFGTQTLSHAENESPKKDSSALRVGRRFLRSDRVSHEHTKAYFARQHAKKERRLKQRQEERRGRRLAQVTLMRKYRVGDLPDIQISTADVVRSLRNICTRDEMMARLFLRLICEHLNENEATRTRIAESLEQSMSATEFHNRAVAATVLEMCLTVLRGGGTTTALHMDKVSTMARSLQLESIGIQILEERLRDVDEGEQPPAPKRKKTKTEMEHEDNATNLWIKIVDLYKSKGDADAARGALRQMQQSDDVSVLLEESTSAWVTVKAKCKQLIAESRNSAEEDALTRAWTESYFNSMQHLSSWTELADEIKARSNNGKNLFDSEWSREFMLPKFIRGEIHNLVGDHKRANTIVDFMESCRKEGGTNFDFLRRRFGLDLCLLYLHEGKLADARLAHDNSAAFFLADWSTQNQFDLTGFKDRLAQLKRLSQADHVLKTLITSPRSKGHERDEPRKITRTILDEWNCELDLAPFASLQHGDDLVRDRSLALRTFMSVGAVEKAEAQQVRARGHLDMAAESNRRHQWEVSVNILQMAKGEVSSLASKHPLHQEYEFLYADTVAVKVINSLDMKFEPRFNALYRFLLTNEEKTESPAKLFGRVKLLKAAEELLGQHDREAQVDLEDLSRCLSKPERQKHFHELSRGVHSIGELRAKILRNVCQELWTRSHLLEGSHWLELACHCHTLLQDFGEGDDALIQLLIESHLRAIAAGNARARQLFPNLMDVAEGNNLGKDLERLVVVKLEQVEPWLFLPWTNQLLSSLSGPCGHLWRGLLVRMAKEFPEAVRFPYLMSSEASQKRDSELDAILKLSSLQERFLQGLFNVCMPEIRIVDHLSQQSSGTDVRLDSLKQQFLDTSDNLYGDLYKECAKKWLKSPRIVGKVNEFIRSVKGSLNAKKTYPTSLATLVPFLSEFHSSATSSSLGGQALEIPGQYGGYQRPRPHRHVRLMCFSDRIRVFRSLRKPIAVTMVGDNGTKFDFIVKCGEDLRQDERIQQVFAIANRSFTNTDLRLRTYSVIPLSQQVGLIECLPNTTSYKSMARPDNFKEGDFPKSKEDFRKLAAKSTAASRAQQFGQWANRNDGSHLRKSLMNLSNGPEGFFFLRDNFVRSHALHCAVGWLLSLGDRHADNLLVSTVTGESIAIDFGYAFGVTAFLPVPELPPFRLTPQIQSLLLPFVNQGPFRETMVRALTCLRRDSSVLLAALSVFVREPTMDWLTFARRQADLKRLDLAKTLEEFPRKKLDVVRRKLTHGGHPSVLALEELEHAAGDSEKKWLEPLEQILLGPEDSTRRELKKEKSVDLTADEQVDCLIEAGTDGSLLRCAYTGWSPLV